MKWTIKEIREYPEDIMPFDCHLDIKTSLLKRHSDILDVDSVNAVGYLTDLNHEIILNGNIVANLSLPSSRTLRPVSVQLQVPINERYVYPGHEGKVDDYDATTIVIENDEIDLDAAVIDLILLNIPLRVIGQDETDDTLPQGNDWDVLTEEQYTMQKQAQAQDQVDPRLAKLKDLLNDQDN
ncbi:YceD family protein [Eremococcus coleocola]|uniref:Putative ACR, COG1399 n=1 Tax=Eremococcus coleocola ACS-139-V-Col8 TaxID=908337 RepID=E4KPB5_9LACT|nr:YceD family protein [Eremococcus coleocola]EFR31061.1 putative ACR, COG1399 [Eremococcus coleocola ACS-139-V-Col8]